MKEVFAEEAFADGRGAGGVKPRMGRINFLNVLPIYHAMETGGISHGYELVHATPSALNGMMERGELAVSSVSCVEYARRPERYWILPDLSIASCGKVLSVLLLSRRPVAELDGRTILLSPASHTSVVLLDVLLHECAHIRASFAVGDAFGRMAEIDGPEAVLLIGDQALLARNHPVYSHVWDLGEVWHNWTGLPFVFGLWVASRDAAAKGCFAEDPAQVLHAAREWGKANMDSVLDAAIARHPFSRADLTRYFAHLSHTLNEREEQGLRRFYACLAAAGVISRVPDIAFWPG